ncbi:MAG: hypothetical protein LH649_12945 [Pseudanabaena sp. CAN_BIN31]|nr:hypothetical protein [Pseudanabaena sp. CAN_BIN31]
MVVVGSVAGMLSYSFGKQALEGVNPSPTGIKLPKVSPTPKDSTKPSPQSSIDGKASFLLNELEIIAEMKKQSQQELGGLTRPTFVAKANISDRQTTYTKNMYTRFDQAYSSMRDPLAISAASDERIATRIAALRERVYTRTRAYDSNFDRMGDRSVASNTDSRLPSLSAPVELNSIRSRWEERNPSLVNSNQMNTQTVKVLPKP